MGDGLIEGRRVLVSDPIADEGVRRLQSGADVDVKTGLEPNDLKRILGGYDALVVRSQTRVSRDVIEAGRNLQVIARAGVGVDNIDLEAATARGIAVVNSPTGNTAAAAEHTIALMLAMARNVPQAHMSMKEGGWKRSPFMGVEVRNKTLGIMGLGRVGSEVARRAHGLSMRLLAYDPFVSPDYARTLRAELVSLDELLERSDFVTVHAALTDATRHMIGAPQLSKMKPGARLVNVARGELVDGDALLQALDEGRLAGAALDVFPEEPPGDTPLVRHPKVIVTPHLGASTLEAQTEVAVEAADQVLAVLSGLPAQNTVNAPFVSPQVHDALAPYVPVASLLGNLLTRLAEGQFVGAVIEYQGEVARHDTGVLRSAALAGLMGPVSEERVNLINAAVIAQRHGLTVTEHKSAGAQEYTSLLAVTLRTTAGDTTLAGTSLRNEVHVVRVNEYWLDMVPSVPYLLFIEHEDLPGSIGAVGTITGRNDINISFMEVGRLSPRGRAMMILGLDDPAPLPVLEEIRSIGHISSARVVRL